MLHRRPQIILMKIRLFHSFNLLAKIDIARYDDIIVDLIIFIPFATFWWLCRFNISVKRYLVVTSTLLHCCEGNTTVFETRITMIVEKYRRHDGMIKTYNCKIISSTCKTDIVYKKMLLYGRVMRVMNYGQKFSMIGRTALSGKRFPTIENFDCGNKKMNCCNG